MGGEYITVYIGRSNILFFSENSNVQLFFSGRDNVLLCADLKGPHMTTFQKPENMTNLPHFLLSLNLH